MVLIQSAPSWSMRRTTLVRFKYTWETSARNRRGATTRNLMQRSLLMHMQVTAVRKRLVTDITSMLKTTTTMFTTAGRTDTTTTKTTTLSMSTRPGRTNTTTSSTVTTTWMRDTAEHKDHDDVDAYKTRKNKYDDVKHGFVSELLKKNPWNKVKYSAVGYQAQYEHVPVYAGLGAPDVNGKTVVVYNAMGDRMACSTLEPVKVLYAPHLAPYPGHKTDFCVDGEIYVSTKDRHQILTYELEGVDPRCSSKERLRDGRCSIRIHEGEDCIAAGEPYWVLGKNKDDPWNEVRYYAEGDKAWAKKVTIYTGLPMAKVVYRTVVIYDYDGKRISCSKLFPVTDLVAKELDLYPGSSTALDVQGRIKVTTQTYKQAIIYKLTGVDALCSGVGHEAHYGCGIVIHEGDTCNNVGDIFWDKAYEKKNPWKDVRYVAGGWKRKAMGEKGVHTGWDLADLLGRTVVVYDYNGNPIACSILKPPRVFKYQFEKVCKSKSPFPAPAPAPAPVKKECFPEDAMVHVSQTGMRHLGDIVVGERILSQKATGHVAFETVLGFIHHVDFSTAGTLLRVEHELGSFRATSNHIVFVDAAGETSLEKVVVGQDLVFVRHGVISTSRIFSVSEEPATVGLMSPLTESGSVIVDGVVASTYASAYGDSVSHAAMHAAFFTVRCLRLSAAGLFRALGCEALSSALHMQPFFLPMPLGSA
eukprot:TRINITY_DN2882_c0_g1_i8.p1 TRINITY_DN2882_c0_g1~~TRINITY_DN2882_c0_g1_i8.p1  ORF type:complete len:699 (-),score=91.61 TRINITY_DN2882_c0_g1_i8:158-2254(-)